MDIEQWVAVLRILPLGVAFWASYRSRQILPATICVLYMALIVSGHNFLGWDYAIAVLSTPMAYLASWYIIKNVRR